MAGRVCASLAQTLPVPSFLPEPEDERRDHEATNAKRERHQVENPESWIWKELLITRVGMQLERPP